MKIEYLGDGAKECPLIRLYDYSQSEACQLRDIVRGLISGDFQSLPLQEETWAVPIGGCCLTLRRDGRNVGAHQLSPLNFECVLDADGWNNVEGLLEPFCAFNTAGFQWLTSQGEVSLLISQTGSW